MSPFFAIDGTVHALLRLRTTRGTLSLTGPVIVVPFAASMKLLKSLTLVLFAVVGLIATVSLESAHALSTGPFLERTGAPDEQTCNSCHRTYPLDSGPGRVAIEGLPTQYTPGQTYPVTVRVADPVAKDWGFQITAITEEGQAAGFFQSNTIAIAALGPSMRLGRFYAQHTLNGTYDGVRGEVSWALFWKAPSQDLGPVTFYAAGNAANGDHTDFYDYIYTTNVTIDGLRRFVRVRLESPAPSAALGSGERVVIRWNATDGDNAVPVSFRVLLSTDGGENYPSVLADSLPATARSFVWSIPDGLVTTDARIRVVVVDSEGVERVDQSRSNLTIGPLGLSQALTLAEAPLGGELTRQAWADVDGDGRQDVVVGRDAGGVLFYRQTTDGTFVEVTEESGLTFPGDVRALAWGDADGDGRPDLAVLSVNATSIWRNDGDSTFSSVGAPTSLPRFADPRAVVWIDVDRDGRLDVVGGGATGMLALRNTGDGFEDASATWHVPDGSVTGLAVGPMLLAATGSGVSAYSFSNGSFVNESSVLGQSATFPALAVVWADLTGDGWLDIVLSGTSGHRVVAGDGGELLFRDATGDLGIGGIAGGTRVLPADYDADGDVDLLVDRGSGGPLVLRNRGASGFDDVTARFAFGPDITSIVWVDRDGSGAIDAGITIGEELRVMSNARSGAGALRLRPRTDADADAHVTDEQPDRDAIGSVVRVDLDGDGDWTTGSRIAIVVGQSGAHVVVNGLVSESADVRADFVDGEGIEASVAAAATATDLFDPFAPILVAAKLSATGKKITLDGLLLPASGGRILVGEVALTGVKAPPRFVGTDGTSTRLVGKDARLTQLLQTKPVAIRVFSSGVFTSPVIVR